MPDNCNDKASLYAHKCIYNMHARTQKPEQTNLDMTSRANVASSSEQGRVPKACEVKAAAIQLATSRREI